MSKVEKKSIISLYLKINVYFHIQKPKPQCLQAKLIFHLNENNAQVKTGVLIIQL